MNEPAATTTDPAAEPPKKAEAFTHAQATRRASPWSLSHRIKAAAWALVCMTLFRPTPKPLKKWRLLLLRLFGAEIHGSPFVDASAVIKYPWHLTIMDRACIGPRADIYNLARITLEPGCVVAQQVYLCTGTHDLDDPNFPLVTAPITIGENAFIGLRALIMPGVSVGKGGVVGGGAVVTKNVPDWTIVGGNPAKPLKERTPIEGFGGPV